VKGRKPSTIVTGAQPVRDLPKAPSWLSKDAKGEWRRAIPSLIERNILDAADLGTLENYCVAQGVVRQIARQLAASLDPALLRAQNAAMTTARQLACELGLTPMSRSKPGLRENDADSSDLD
jgi:P27 family predicted phage terminase small subunit